ncbi:MAG TPA: PA14 domain-containing protein, partial [Clostridia bacterium]|nr:PA14 domain-containing protein [Clostridia bacterium]
MRKYLAVLMTLILVFTSSAGAFAQGQVEVQHYDVSQLNEHPNTNDGDAQKWAANSLDTEEGNIVIKKAAYGTDNWSGNSGDDAFLENQDNTIKNAQKIYGYIAPTENVSKFSVNVDDGLRLYIDENQNGSFESDELLIDAYHVQGATNYDTNVNLEAGKDYKFEIHYFNWGGWGALEFKANDNEMDLDWFRIDQRKNSITLENEDAIDFIYINDNEKNIYKYFPAIEALEVVEATSNLYYDLANKNDSLYGVRDSKLYALSSEGASEKDLHDNHINSLTHNNGYFFYVVNQNVYAYHANDDEVIYLVDTGHTSAGDLVELNNDLYFTTTDNKLVKIEFSDFSVS